VANAAGRERRPSWRRPWLVGIGVACLTGLAIGFIPGSFAIELLFPVPLVLGGLGAHWAGASGRRSAVIAIVASLVTLVFLLIVSLVLFTIHMAYTYP
jgi:hypothetical protein